MGNEEVLHRVAQRELMANGSKKDALRAIVTLCQATFQSGEMAGSSEGGSPD
jgi:hypothetical protein